LYRINIVPTHNQLPDLKSFITEYIQGRTQAIVPPEKVLLAHREDKLLCIDSEFAGPIPLQFGIVDCNGNVVLEAVVDYGKSVDKMLAAVLEAIGGAQAQIRKGAIRKFYDNPALKLTATT